MGLLRQRFRERSEKAQRKNSADNENADMTKPSKKAMRLHLDGINNHQEGKTPDLSPWKSMHSPAMMTPAKEYPGIGFATEFMSPNSPDATTRPERVKSHRTTSKRHMKQEMSTVGEDRAAEDSEDRVGVVAEDKAGVIAEDKAGGAAPKKTAVDDKDTKSESTGAPVHGESAPDPKTGSSELDSTSASSTEKPKRPRIGGVVARRTPSGNLKGERRPTNASLDFIDNTELEDMENDADNDAAEVLRHTQALSDRLSYKDVSKVHSVMGALLRSQGECLNDRLFWLYLLTILSPQGSDRGCRLRAGFSVTSTESPGGFEYRSLPVSRYTFARCALIHRNSKQQYRMSHSIVLRVKRSTGEFAALPDHLFDGLQEVLLCRHLPSCADCKHTSL